MSKIAFLFPGQGSQFVGMGKSLSENFPVAKKMFQQAGEIMNFDLAGLCFDGPEETLRQTRYTQPAIFVHSLIINHLLVERKIRPQATAGHSLGEYSALVSAGALTFEDGLRLVKLRGELMQISGEKNPGTMAAIIGGTPEMIEEACREAQSEGVVQPANFNCPGQIVISGSIPGVQRAMVLAKEKGARMAKELVVSGAFHSPLMADALDGLMEALANVQISTPEVPVYCNVTAAPTTDPEVIRDLLRQQLLSPVRWEEILLSMIAVGHDLFYEAGPGKVLQGLLKRTNRGITCNAIGEAQDFEQLEN